LNARSAFLELSLCPERYLWFTLYPHARRITLLKLKHIQQLDGIRGLAILLVLAFHSRVVFATTAEIPYFGFRLLGLGWSGVDLFFVLSGFLITGILIDSRDSSTYFRTFYARRVLRIFPLYFFYLFLVLVVCRYGWRWYAREDLWQSTNSLWFVTYLMNWMPADASGKRFLYHLWSLAIEEQFYLVWPAVVWFFPRRRLTWVCAALAASAFATRCWMSGAIASTETIYEMTPCRLDCLAVGAFVAIGVRDFRPLLDRWCPRAFAVCTAGFLVVAAVSPNPVWSDLPMRTLGASLLAVGYGCVVFRAATARTGWACRLFSSRLLGQFGKYSYGMYVLHAAPWEMTAFLVRALDHRRLPEAMILAIKYAYLPALTAASFGLAWLSMRFMEHPFLSLKSRFPYGERAHQRDREVEPFPARV
jgi:peptidoglycan/LPS O-acetylase OafA/YrhL